MSAIDDILQKDEVEQGRVARGVTTTPQQNIVEQQKPLPQQQDTQVPQQQAAPQQNDAVKRMWEFVDSIKPNKEQIERENKMNRNRALISAIGDGISALANMYYTTKGAPNAYDPTKSLSAKNNERWQNIKKQREENRDIYNAAYMRALQYEDAYNRNEREYQNKLQQQEFERRWRQRQAKIAQENNEYQKQRQEKLDKQAQENWKARFDEDKRRADRSYNFQVSQHNNNVAVRREAAAATRARGVRGKQLGFADGNGNQVAIYENVWKGSMQQVYDVLYADMVNAYNRDKANNPRVPRHKTQQEKEDFVKQNWHKSPRASQIMLTLSSIDPATMTSEVNDEDYSKYEQGGEEDYSQYEVK